VSRPSHVRDAIERLLSSSHRHDWSCDAVLAALRHRRVAADFSSVFRSLEVLADRGVIGRVDLGDGKARYEPVTDHHEHIRCDDCGTVSAIPGCAVDGARAAVRRATGFRVTGHRVLFSGVCPKCA
jgi:Fe2+ or Zn2+ uptake regulation protein